MLVVSASQDVLLCLDPEHPCDLCTLWPLLHKPRVRETARMAGTRIDYAAPHWHDNVCVTLSGTF